MRQRTDVFTKVKRSAVMAAIHSHGNKDTELRLIALMREYGITGWRRNAPVFGKPDFVFPRERVAVFVDGWLPCFAAGLRSEAPLERIRLRVTRFGTAARVTRRCRRRDGHFGKPSSRATHNATAR